MQPRKCPRCEQVIKEDIDYFFDEKMNLICGSCGKIAFPTNWQTNNEINQDVRYQKGGWESKTYRNNSQQNFPKQVTGSNENQINIQLYGVHGRGEKVQSYTPNIGEEYSDYHTGGVNPDLSHKSGLIPF